MRGRPPISTAGRSVVIFRVVNGVMALLYGAAALLQYNDPDPVRWMLIYAAAMIVAALVAVRGAIAPTAPLLVAVVALVWGLVWSTDVRDPASYARMFESWQMKNVAVEEARETSGLLLVGGWMLVLAVQGWRHRRASRR
jgi:hypothetical protein